MKDAHLQFPGCTIYNMPQRSDEWFQVRKGILTASDMGVWLTQTTKTAEKARLNMIAKLLAQSADCEEEPRYETWAMARGVALEPMAVEHFAQRHGVTVAPAGFCRSNDGMFGCSPDGLIYSAGIGLETKSPVPSTHVKYLLDGVLPDIYKCQVHGSMAVTGAQHWFFQSFCPGLPTLEIMVKEDDFTKQLRDGLHAFEGQYQVQRARIAELWEAELGKEDAA